MAHVFDFGAVGDGERDDTEAILHAIRDGDGPVRLGRGDYRITRTLEVTLREFGRFGLEGSNGTARIVMSSPGPALRIVGNHQGTAAPSSFRPETWNRERMPTVRHLEIVGAHAEADGIELVGTVQATLSGLLLRRLRNGICLRKRNRNVVISDCHIFENTGVGIYCNGVNLHQFNVVGNHISYNRLGGIRIEGSEIRNLQITGNDIEYNNFRTHPEAAPDEPTAEIFIDSRQVEGGVVNPSVREVTIASNTIQATYSPGGANVRILGPEPSGLLPPGMATITGNVIGNQAVNLHLTHCRGLAISGNFIYAGYEYSLLAQSCSDVALGTNSWGHNYWVPDREVDNYLRLDDCQDWTMTGLQLRGAPSGPSPLPEEAKTTLASLDRRATIDLRRCHRMNLTGCSIRDPNGAGIALEETDSVSIVGCQVHDTRSAEKREDAIKLYGENRGLVK